MSTSEFPESGQANLGQTQPIQSGPVAGMTAEIAGLRARTVDLHNPRFLCWTAMSCGIVAVPLGICMMLEGVSLLLPMSAITFRAALAAAQWIVGGFLMCMMCTWTWQWGTRMLGLHVKLDARGVDFNLERRRNRVSCSWHGSRWPRSSRSAWVLRRSTTFWEKTEAGPASRRTHFFGRSVWRG